MQTFKNVIVRRPCRAVLNGITTSPELGTPDYELAVKQHDSYIKALEQICGCKISMLGVGPARDQVMSI